MNTLYDRLTIVRERVKKTNKQSVLIIQQHPGTDMDYLYFPPIRESISSIIFFAEVSTPQQVKDILDSVSSEIDRFIVDIDKKRCNSVDIISEVERYPLNVKLLYYSDYDVWGAAAVDFISQIEGSLSDKNVLIYGLNYLTTRVIRKLLEIGANVFTDDEDKSNEYPLDMYNTVRFNSGYLHKISEYSGDLDIIIGGEVLTPIKNLNYGKYSRSVYDIGLGNFSKEFIESCYCHGSNIYRFDNRAGLSSVVLGLMETDYLITNNMGKVKVGQIDVVSGGVLGTEDSIVVDNAFSPEYVFGVADGKGMFKSELSKKNVEDLKAIKALIEK